MYHYLNRIKDEQLRKDLEQLIQWNEQYHGPTRSTVPDAVYDDLKRKVNNTLATLQLPEYHPVGSRTGASGDIWVKHQHRFYSLRDLFSYEEIQKWVKNAFYKKPIDWGYNLCLTAEWKWDGLALGLIYNKQGLLERVVTRGDGDEGIDVTQRFNVLTDNRYVNRVGGIGVAEIRGEGLVRKSYLAKLNEIRVSEELEPYKSCRAVAAAMIRSSETFPRGGLEFHIYDIIYEDGTRPKNISLQCQNRNLDVDSFIGQFQVEPIHEDTSGLGKDLEVLAEDRDKLDFDVDGVVLKLVAEDHHRKEIGWNASYPLWAVAYKFPANGGWSTLEGVTFQVGRTGKITPVGKIAPVTIGVEYTSVTLANFDEIERLELQLNDKVFIERRGDVIPKVMYREATPESTPIVNPTECPDCQSPLDDLDDLRCNNVECPGRLRESILYTLSRPLMNVSGIGKVAATNLVANGLVTKPHDLFLLTETDLKAAKVDSGNIQTYLEGLKRYYVDGVLTVPAWLWVAVTGLKDIGPSTARKVIGDKVTQENIHAFCGTQSLEGSVMISEWISDVPSRVAFTGSLKHLTEPPGLSETLLGYGVSKDDRSVTKTTKLLVVGEGKPSKSKIDKALKYGVLILHPESWGEVLKTIATLK